MNRKGETLVEVMVSMTIFAVLVLAASTMIMFSMKTSSNALAIIRDTNEDVRCIEENESRDSESGTFDTNISISFEINNDKGDIIKEHGDYDIDDIESVTTKNGFLRFIFD